jgi:hypothetical protein
MYRAALAAQNAGEAHVSGDRLVGALLRTDSIQEFCSRATVSATGVLESLGDAPSPSFEECAERAKSGPALELRPLDPLLKPVFDDVLQRESQLAISPLALLLRILRVDSSLASRLAPYGLTAEAILKDLDTGKENA